MPPDLVDGSLQKPGMNGVAVINIVGVDAKASKLDIEVTAL
jgi:hypothetical protein